MIYKIEHRIEYSYPQPVYLERHQLHLIPREEAFQKLKQFTLKVTPEPLVLTRITDLFGNPAHDVWFKGHTKSLHFYAVSAVEVSRFNPFDYLLHESAMRLPLNYSSSLLSGLRPFLLRSHEEIDRVRLFSDSVAARSGHDAVGFLSELCLEIHSKIRYVAREEGASWPAEKTLSEGKGSCRDLAVLFMTCCRLQGLAARFTSGYADLGSETDSNELHAWAEVYLEGAGWRGYDPSSGLAVCEQYISLASSPDPALVTPVLGTFRGKDPGSQIRTEVTIRAVEGPSENFNPDSSLPAVNQ